jgi:hypothetical protein
MIELKVVGYFGKAYDDRIGRAGYHTEHDAGNDEANGKSQAVLYISDAMHA